MGRAGAVGPPESTITQPRLLEPDVLLQRAIEESGAVGKPEGRLQRGQRQRGHREPAEPGDVLGRQVTAADPDTGAGGAVARPGHDQLDPGLPLQHPFQPHSRRAWPAAPGSGPGWEKRAR